MKTQDYKAMLRAVEQAIEICDQSVGYMDQMHQQICAELRVTRSRLLRLIDVPETSAEPQKS